MPDPSRQGVLFDDVFSERVVAVFDADAVTSDGGAVLLAATDRRRRPSERLASCLREGREAGEVRHEPLDLVRRRVYAPALGYADGNDASRLSSDPSMKLACGRAPIEGEDLADERAISGHLLRIERDRMGLGGSPLEHRLAVATRLRATRERGRRRRGTPRRGGRSVTACR
jgi:hypothetical protein